MFGFRELDRVLRGETTTREIGAAAGRHVAVGPLVHVVVLLAVGYGLCMGVYSLCSREEPEYRQLLASAFKVPSLLLLTLFVTFPSLYVFNTLLGSRLRVEELARLLAGSIGVLVAVLAAFGPIVAFFSVTTASYPFIVLLNVVFFAVAGAFGFYFLFRSLAHLVEMDRERMTFTEITDDADRVVVHSPDRQTPMPAVFKAWVAVFALVGSQMSWVLRPFIGSPNQPFTWFRLRDASFLESILRTVKALFAQG